MTSSGGVLLQSVVHAFAAHEFRKIATTTLFLLHQYPPGYHLRTHHNILRYPTSETSALSPALWSRASFCPHRGRRSPSSSSSLPSPSPLDLPPSRKMNYANSGRAPHGIALLVVRSRLRSNPPSVSVRSPRYKERLEREIAIVSSGR